MLSELCGHLRNWFERDKYIGDFTISNGVIIPLGKSMNLLNGQYIRIVGSILNDGVYQYSTESSISGLKDETFHGAVWSLAIPKELVAIDKEIDAWQAKNGDVESASMSPFNSESFGGYSYTKSSGRSEESNSGLGGWQNAFANRLSQWRKI